MDNKKILLIAGGALLFLILILLGFLLLFSNKAKPVTITYWGLWEPDAVYETVIADYKRLRPNVTIKYSKQTQINYRDKLTAAIAQSSGPDIFRIHNSWLPMFKNNLAQIPMDKALFYPVAGELYPYAIPLEIDTLALYVNDDILRAGGVEVPTIWDGDNGFLAVARKLTVKDNNGRVTTSGASIGNATNVDHWQEIIGLMMLQTGVDLNREANSSAAVDALNYYATFGRERLWEDTQDNSTLAFANGKVAMYFGPSWRYFDIKAINPKLNFHITSVPQLAGGQTTNYATYWAEAVSAKSANKTEAFAFLKFLSSKDVLTKLYDAQTKIRGFGEPYSRIDMASLLASDPNVSPFIAAAPTAKTWYLASGTFDGDTGINSRIGKYYLDAVNQALGGNAKGGLDTAKNGIAQVLASYGVSK